MQKDQVFGQEWGKWFEFRCSQLGLTYSDVARMSGAHQTLPQKWASCQAFPHRNKWHVLARVLGVSVEDMLAARSPEDKPQEDRPAHAEGRRATDAGTSKADTVMVEMSLEMARLSNNMLAELRASAARIDDHEKRLRRLEDRESASDESNQKTSGNNRKAS